MWTSGFGVLGILSTDRSRQKDHSGTCQRVVAYAGNSQRRATSIILDCPIMPLLPRCPAVTQRRAQLPLRSERSVLSPDLRCAVTLKNFRYALFIGGIIHAHGQNDVLGNAVESLDRFENVYAGCRRAAGKRGGCHCCHRGTASRDGYSKRSQSPNCPAHTRRERTELTLVSVREAGGR
jgi:hypothetical protein